jgi:hypothetical protein
VTKIGYKVDKKDLDKINLEMTGWTIDNIKDGTSEDVFIFEIRNNGKCKQVTLCANDLGGWFGGVKKLNRAVKKKKHEQR